MPDEEGTWTFHATNNARSLDAVTGTFQKQFNFQHADGGTRYFPVSTTAHGAASTLSEFAIPRIPSTSRITEPPPRGGDCAGGGFSPVGAVFGNPGETHRPPVRSFAARGDGHSCVADEQVLHSVGKRSSQR
ncbi:hypothetical protein [Streptomyces sp. NPDC051016]|uniref:hypothetical protein n=1 Tax=Streptomyces sp. NPDC051016 TaxID=3365638 RepID=UPI0037938E08